jgi:hypothetical protein
MHFVEVRRWQDIRKKDSVNADPFNPNLKVPNPELGYPGGPFDPLGFSKGNFKEAQTKEIKNGRLAMVAFVGFTIQAQATGKGPLANLTDHLSAPFSNNVTANIGHCMVPTSVDIQVGSGAALLGTEAIKSLIQAWHIERVVHERFIARIRCLLLITFLLCLSFAGSDAAAVLPVAW